MKKYGIKIKSIVKCNDKFLIVERWYDDRIEEPYQWEFLDGEAEFGESPDVAGASGDCLHACDSREHGN